MEVGSPDKYSLVGTPAPPIPLTRNKTVTCQLDMNKTSRNGRLLKPRVRGRERREKRKKRGGEKRKKGEGREMKKERGEREKRPEE